jgi:hypothetical protein
MAATGTDRPRDCIPAGFITPMHDYQSAFSGQRLGDAGADP